MNVRRCTLLLLLLATSALNGLAEDDAPRSKMKEVLKARASDEARKNPIAAPAQTPPPKSPKADAEPTATSTPTNPAANASAATATPPSPAVSLPGAPASTVPTEPAKAAEQAPTMLPKVEVRKDRITELDRQLHQQAKEIAREKKNTKTSETDDALNNPKVSKLLAIFGGESSKHRSGIAQERVELMEAESDLIEAIAHTKSKEEKAELEKQLEQLKALRRDLEKSLR